MLTSFIHTLRLKVRPESYGWLNAAAIEVNQTFNFCNEASFAAATRTDLKRMWVCVRCGVLHDRDVNSARNILASGFRCGTSVSGNEPSLVQRPPSQVTRLREAGSNAVPAAA